MPRRCASAVAALAALRLPALPQQQEGGAAAAGAGSEQGTKRKRGDQSDDDGCTHEEGSEDAAPLC
jgi:hypothetical protein